MLVEQCSQSFATLHSSYILLRQAQLGPPRSRRSARSTTASPGQPRTLASESKCHPSKSLMRLTTTGSAFGLSQQLTMFAVLWVGGAAFHPHGRVFCVGRLFLVYSQRRSTCTFVVEVCSRKNVTSASRMHVFCGLPSEALESRLFGGNRGTFPRVSSQFLASKQTSFSHNVRQSGNLVTWQTEKTCGVKQQTTQGFGGLQSWKAKANASVEYTTHAFESF